MARISGESCTRIPSSCFEQLQNALDAMQRAGEAELVNFVSKVSRENDGRLNQSDHASNCRNRPSCSLADVQATIRQERLAPWQPPTAPAPNDGPPTLTRPKIADGACRLRSSTADGASCCPSVHKHSPFVAMRDVINPRRPPFDITKASGEYVLGRTKSYQHIAS